VRGAVLDKNAEVPPGATTGVNPERDAEPYTASKGGVTALGKYRRVPEPAGPATAGDSHARDGRVHDGAPVPAVSGTAVSVTAAWATAVSVTAAWATAVSVTAAWATAVSVTAAWATAVSGTAVSVTAAPRTRPSLPPGRRFATRLARHPRDARLTGPQA
jgi:hypothetical protein